MQLLQNSIRTYAWGSHTAIAAIQGRPVPATEPEAELWMGAHPSAPSVLEPEGVPLNEAIEADPGGLLGRAVAAEFGARLPYLFKLLAAGQPLSLQAHPTAEQAREGYEREAGLPPDERTYVDPYHKPELLVAIEDFDALCGFRHPEASAALIEGFGVAALKPVVAALRTGSPAERLRGAVELLMDWPAGERAELVQAVAAAGRSLSTSDSGALAAELGERYPGDVGVVVALLLNHVRLRPDEAVYMPAGNLHAYLRGTGMEIMAASDNVLRGGLTPKRVNVPELLRVLRFEVLDDPVVRPVPLGDGALTWAAPVREFRLVKATGGGELPGAGPRIAFCRRGRAVVRTRDGSVPLANGAAVFIAAADGPATATGDAEIWVAAPAG